MEQLRSIHSSERRKEEQTFILINHEESQQAETLQSTE